MLLFKWLNDWWKTKKYPCEPAKNAQKSFSHHCKYIYAHVKTLTCIHRQLDTDTRTHTCTHAHTLLSSPECHHLSQAFKSDLGPFRKAIRKESFSGTQKMKSGLIIFVFITRPQKVTGAKSWVRSVERRFCFLFVSPHWTNSGAVETNLHQCAVVRKR